MLKRIFNPWSMVIAALLLVTLIKHTEVKRYVEKEEFIPSIDITSGNDEAVKEAIEFIRKSNFIYCKSYETDRFLNFEVLPTIYVADMKKELNELSTGIYLIYHNHGLDPAVVLQVRNRKNAEKIDWYSYNGIAERL